MYLIYSDESGTSKNQQVVVVAAVIMDPDVHWRAAERALRAAVDCYVPEDLRSGFIFHAADVVHKYRERSDWILEQRLNLIKCIAFIPRQLGMAVAVGKYRHDAPAPVKGTPAVEMNSRHALAFWRCIGRANEKIRQKSLSNVVTILVAEDLPEKRKMMRRVLKLKAIETKVEHMRPTLVELKTGKIVQTNISGSIERSVDTAHFLEKSDGPMLQIADACAYSFRRFFSQGRGGDELVRVMLGGNLNYEDWAGPDSESIWWPEELSRA